MNTFDTPEKVKQLVAEKYGQIAEKSREENASSCCGGTCGCSTGTEAIMAEDYSKLEGYVADADLGLGCGLPTKFALIKEGDTVVDLGSGAGNDVFVARSVTGEKGKVIGIDMTPRMIEKSRINAEKLGYNNVEFRFGEIESLPLSSNMADVVVSNCVFNLVPDKSKAFEETFRVLKPGGHFSISDIVIEGEIPDGIREKAELYVGCVSGAIDKEVYLSIIRQTGFSNIIVQSERKITLPDEIVAAYLTNDELLDYKNGKFGISSITVFGEKPNLTEKEKQEQKAACCGSTSTCC